MNKDDRLMMEAYTRGSRVTGREYTPEPPADPGGEWESERLQTKNPLTGYYSVLDAAQASASAINDMSDRDAAILAMCKQITSYIFEIFDTEMDWIEEVESNKLPFDTLEKGTKDTIGQSQERYGHWHSKHPTTGEWIGPGVERKKDVENWISPIIRKAYRELVPEYVGAPSTRDRYFARGIADQLIWHPKKNTSGALKVDSKTGELTATKDRTSKIKNAAAEVIGDIEDALDDQAQAAPVAPPSRIDMSLEYRVKKFPHVDVDRPENNELDSQQQRMWDLKIPDLEEDFGARKITDDLVKFGSQIENATERDVIDFLNNILKKGLIIVAPADVGSMSDVSGDYSEYGEDPRHVAGDYLKTHGGHSGTIGTAW